MGEGIREFGVICRHGGQLGTTSELPEVNRVSDVSDTREESPQQWKQSAFHREDGSNLCPTPTSHGTLQACDVKRGEKTLLTEL